MDETRHPKRHLKIEGTRNIRDLGGYGTRDGGTTRWRRFLRADSLHLLPRSAQEFLIDYGVSTIIDLRMSAELRDYRNVFTGSERVAYQHLNMLTDAYQPVAPRPGQERFQTLAVDYCWWLDNLQNEIARVFENLADVGAGAALYHCHSGKDRTGITSALLLGLANVPNEMIAADYGLTAFNNAAADPKFGTWEEYQQDHCPPECMLLVLDHLETAYGGVEEYLRQIGLSDSRIGCLRDALVD